MRKVLATIAVSLALSMAAASPALAQSPPKVLSTKDTDVYAVAFSAVRQGQFDALDEAKHHVSDPCLIGRLAYLKLMHPDYHAEFDELKAWLGKYKDQPDADKVYALAKKRRPGSALEPIAPGGEAPTGMALAPTGEGLTKPKSSVDPKMQAAREAFYNDGDVTTAFALATKSGERWVGGMAAYRLERYSTAVERFAALSRDATQTEWVRSGAAFWAARSSVAAGEPGKAVEYLRLAARTPYTFYGLIAERQLGLEPAVKAEGYDIGGEEQAETAAIPAQYVEPLTGKALLKFVKTDKRAKRAAAYMQIGQRGEANEELRLALFDAGSDAARKKWRALADAVGSPLDRPATATSRRRGFDLSDYSTPDLAPVGGYTLERALVYAIIRQESHFNPAAASAAGAYGLMQMTPATAAYNAGVDAASIDSSLLLDPGTNMRLGQDYVARLLAQTNGDILRTVAAYNAGPRGINKLAAALPDADSLLLIESLAGAETREFVQKVMSNYWIYRQLFNQPSPTLDAAAAGSKMVLAAWDQTAAAFDTPSQPATDPTPSPAPTPARLADNRPQEPIVKAESGAVCSCYVLICALEFGDGSAAFQHARARRRRQRLRAFRKPDRTGVRRRLDLGRRSAGAGGHHAPGRTRAGDPVPQRQPRHRLRPFDQPLSRLRTRLHLLLRPPGPRLYGPVAWTGFRDQAVFQAGRRQASGEGTVQAELQGGASAYRRQHRSLPAGGKNASHHAWRAEGA